MDEFHDAHSALTQQRPPLLALEGQEQRRALDIEAKRRHRGLGRDAHVGIGAIVIDCGTGLHP